MAEIYRMTEKRFSRAKKLIRRLCANYDSGNCLLLDDGECQPCPQLISYSLLCRYFIAAVLPDDEEFYAEIMRANTKTCAECGRPFPAEKNNTLYCQECAAKRIRRSKRRWAAKNRCQR